MYWFMFIKIIEFLPVIAFFVTYRLTADMITATSIVIGTCLLSTAVEYLLTHTLSRMQVFLAGAIILFGVPTVLLNDPQIIKWKVTVVNLILASAIFVCQYLIHKNPFSYLFGKEIPLPPQAWKKLSVWWMFYFVLAAGLNLVIAFCLPALFGINEKEAESLWVDYKTFGNAILNFVFALICGFWLIRAYPQLFQDKKEEKQEKAEENK